MNRVVVLKEGDTAFPSDEFYYIDKGPELPDSWVPKNRDARRYVDSFLRKEGSHLRGHALDTIIYGFLNYLQGIKNFDKAKMRKKKKYVEVKSRFDILDL